MATQDPRCAHNAVFRLWLHLVLVTNDRRRVLDDTALARCEALARETCERWEVLLAEFNGEADHVHLLLDVPPKLRPSDLVNVIKTRTSRMLRAEFSTVRAEYPGKAVLWAPSYCLLSAGVEPLVVLKRYIEEQDMLP